MIIREETSEDIPRNYPCQRTGFWHLGEAQAIDALRQRKMVTLSLVAVTENQVAGHILFSPVDIVSGGKSIGTALGLAPLAVLPAFQGMELDRSWSRLVANVPGTGSWAVILLGHPDYYARFGFTQASRFGLPASGKFLRMLSWPWNSGQVLWMIFPGLFIFNPNLMGCKSTV